LSSAGATYGISAGFFDFASALAFIALAYGFLPVYRKCGVFTLPEYIQKRYSKALKIYLACLAVVLYVVGKVAVSLYCGSIMIEAILDVNPTVAIAVLLGVTCAFTASGGLKAVIYVEVFNTVLLIVGGLVAAGYCFSAGTLYVTREDKGCPAARLQVLMMLCAVGGWQGMHDHLASIKQPQLGHLYQTSGQYSIFGLLLGGPWMILFFHCWYDKIIILSIFPLLPHPHLLRHGLQRPRDGATGAGSTQWARGQARLHPRRLFKTVCSLDVVYSWHCSANTVSQRSAMPRRRWHM
jgi:hypothetical protein